MKNLLFLSIALVLIVSCASKDSMSVSSQSKTSSIANDTIRIANDSLEYEIIIFEPGFNAWIVTQPPRGYYSQAAMEISNHFKVTVYNLRHQSPSRYDANLYPFPIDYNRNTDYGYEVNYMLFNYFRFFEKQYKQTLR